MDKIIDRVLCVVLTLLTLLTTNAWSAEWPQYRGMNRDGVSKETGLSKTWGAEGPRVIWKVPLGEGYSGMSVVNGRIYTMDAQNGNEYVVCFDAVTGKEIWRSRSDATFINDQGNGPRSTPTVDGEMIYTFGAQSYLYAWSAKDGKKIWENDLKKTLGAKVPIWGVSSSPLVEGNLLILPVGGGESNAVVAFHKKTGALVWKSETDEPGYSSPLAVNLNGIRQIIIFSGTMLLSVSPTDGKVLWKYPWKTNWFVNSAMPIFVPEDKIFISTSYDRGAALLRVRNSGGEVSVEEIWLSKEMKNHFNSSVLHEGYIYGFDNAVLKCIDANTAEEKWRKSGFGKGSLILADGHLIVLSERGGLVIVEAAPAAYKEKARAQVLQGKCWTQPTLSEGKLYLRNQKQMICIDLAG